MAGERLSGWLDKTMLVLADRRFYSCKLWRMADATELRRGPRLSRT
jgi:hypothetical protein